MAKLLGIIKLCLDLGAIALDLLRAAILLYRQYMSDLTNSRDYTTA